MRALDVSLPALPAAAAALLAFADELPRPEADGQPGELQPALAEFCRSWARELDRLRADARAAAADVTAAGETYARLERLLIGGARR
jgi:hypothetical protein